jgi:hypothetical protein
MHATEINLEMLAVLKMLRDAQTDGRIRWKAVLIGEEEGNRKIREALDAAILRADVYAEVPS